MPFYLSQRDIHTKERMDRRDCDRDELFNTYRQFKIVNRLISGWHRIYKKLLKPEMLKKGEQTTLLDIGFGGGDIPIQLAKWTQRDGIDLQITAIDTDPRACEFIQEIDEPRNLTFEQCSSTDLAERGASFDIVISNHLLHHLEVDMFRRMLNETKLLSNRLVLFNDIERSDTGYLLFNLLSRPVFRSSFITEDGLTSIRRSYTADELRRIVPGDWRVQRLFPFRLLLSYRHDDE